MNCSKFSNVSIRKVYCKMYKEATIILIKIVELVLSRRRDWIMLLSLCQDQLNLLKTLVSFISMLVEYKM